VTDTDIQIRTGAAGNQASNVLNGAWRAVADGKITQEQVGSMHAFLTAEFFSNMSTVSASALLVTHAGATPVQGFVPQPNPYPTAHPQVQEVQAAPQGFAPANAGFPPQQAGPFDNVVPLQQHAPAQAPGTGVDKTTAAWQRYFANPAGYYDNRQDKKSPNGPDFKSKADGDDALWLKSKYGNAPDWVWAQLGYQPGTY